MSTDASAPKREPVDVAALRERIAMLSRPWIHAKPSAVHKEELIRDMGACLDLIEELDTSNQRWIGQAVELRKEIEDLRALLLRALDHMNGDGFAFDVKQAIDAALRGEPKEGM